MRPSDDLLAAYLAGELEGDKRDQVAAWLAAHPHVQAELDQIRVLTPRVEIREVDTALAWQKVRSAKARGARTLSLRWLRWAAAVIVLAIGALYVYPTLWQTPETVLAAVEDGQTWDLPDGSTVQLRAGAELRFPETWEGEQRRVHLRGTAYFDVLRDTIQPFIINASEGQVQVLGTSFQVESADGRTSVSVSSGRVALLARSGQKIELTPGLTGEIRNGQLTSHRIKSSSDVSWSGYFEFSDAPIYEVIENLNQYYDKKIVIEGDRTSDCLLSARFRQLPLSEILEVIQLTCDVTIEQDGEQVVIRH